MSARDGDVSTKAVIPAAGLGTRFLPGHEEPAQGDAAGRRQAVDPVRGRGGGRAPASPTSSSSPAAASGRSRTTSTATSSSSTTSSRRASTTCSKEVQAITELADIHYIRQRDPLGLGHAVSVAREHVGDEPFAVLLGDDIMVDDVAAAPLDARRARALRPRRCSRCMEVDREEISSYGCVEPEDGRATSLVRVQSIVEKPKPEDAPSNLAVIGRYVFTPGDLRRARPHRARRRRRAPAHRRDRAAARDADRCYGRVVHRRPLRHRPEDRLPPGQRRARARPGRPRPRARASSCVELVRDARARRDRSSA